MVFWVSMYKKLNIERSSCTKNIVLLGRRYADINVQEEVERTWCLHGRQHSWNELLFAILGAIPMGLNTKCDVVFFPTRLQK